MKDAALHQDDSDLEKKRREAEALLQSMGITSEVPVGMFLYCLVVDCAYVAAVISTFL